MLPRPQTLGGHGAEVQSQTLFLGFPKAPSNAPKRCSAGEATERGGPGRVTKHWAWYGEEWWSVHPDCWPIQVPACVRSCLSMCTWCWRLRMTPREKVTRRWLHVILAVGEKVCVEPQCRLECTGFMFGSSCTRNRGVLTGAADEIFTANLLLVTLSTG